MSNEVSEKVKDFVDFLEDKYGELEGFECLLEHKLIDGENQGFADIKSFRIYHLTKSEIPIK